MLVKIVAVMCARNEEETLPHVLSALNRQSLPLHRMIVVNDGSIDHTSEIAREHGATVVDLPVHHSNVFLTCGGLARRFNAGLAKVPPCDYVFILGADDIIPSDYVETLVGRMEADSKLVVASGQLVGQPSDISAPRGGGRLVKTWFWKHISDLRFPRLWCWEEYMCYKANQLGLKTRGFPDVLFKRVRQDQGKRSPIKAFGDGRSMYALGYFWVYALLRCVTTFLRNRSEGWYLFLGWATHRKVQQADVAEWLRFYQLRQVASWFHVVRKVKVLVKKMM